MISRAVLLAAVCSPVAEATLRLQPHRPVATARANARRLPWGVAAPAAVRRRDPDGERLPVGRGRADDAPAVSRRHPAPPGCPSCISYCVVDEPAVFDAETLTARYVLEFKTVDVTATHRRLASGEEMRALHEHEYTDDSGRERRRGSDVLRRE